MSELLYKFDDEEGVIEFRMEKSEDSTRYFLTDGFNEEEILLETPGYEPIFKNASNGEYTFFDIKKIYNFMCGFNLALKESSR